MVLLLAPLPYQSIEQPWPILNFQIRFNKIDEVMEMNNKQVEAIIYGLIGLLGSATVYLFLELTYILFQRAAELSG